MVVAERILPRCCSASTISARGHSATSRGCCFGSQRTRGGSTVRGARRRPGVRLFVEAALAHTDPAQGVRQLDVCEWRCVSKRAGDHGRAVRQCPYLEVLSPGRIRSVDSKLRCRDETKANIEPGIAEQGDQGSTASPAASAAPMTACISASPAPCRWRIAQDADRSEPKCVEYADTPASADHVADDLLATLGNHRQRRDPSGIIAKRAEQARLHRLSTNPRPAKGRRSHGVDGGSVLKRLATDDHERLLANGLPCSVADVLRLACGCGSIVGLSASWPRSSSEARSELWRSDRWG